MKCLVTGCAGFIGSHLAEALLKEGHTVRGVDCFTDYYPRLLKASNLSVLKRSKDFEFVEEDLSSARLARMVERVEVVFHLAAQPGVRASWGTTFSHYVKDNVVATQRLLESLKDSSVSKVIFASSSSVYGDSERMPTPEDATPAPVSPYGATKLLGESLCRIYFKNFALPVVALRYFTVYGPRQRPDMAFSRFISRIPRGGELDVFGDGGQMRDFTFVGDIAAGSLLAMKATPGTTYNLGGGRSYSLNEVIAAMEKILGKRAKVRKTRTVPGDVRNTAADISRAARDLGYRPAVSLEEGLRAQIDHQLGPKG